MGAPSVTAFRWATVAIASVLLAGCGLGSTTQSPARSASVANPGLDLTPAPTVSPGSNPTASPTASVAGAWKRAPDQPSLRAVQLQHVIWTGTRFVATGTDGSFLESPDGLAWSLQDQSWPTGQVWGMAAASRGVVAVGEIDGHAATWFSSDGSTWSIGPDAGSLHASDGAVIRMRDVTETGDGWLAVGEEDEPCQIGCPLPIRAVIWTSADGIDWSQAPADASLANAAMTGVTRAGPGYVAVGQSSPMPTPGVVWTSTDGRSWSRVADAPILHPPPDTDQTFGAFMQAVTIGREGTLVAVGSVGSQEVASALAWWSTDGETWAAGTGDRFRYGQLFDVAATPTGFLATGPSGALSCLGGIWSSTVGRSWSCVAEDPAFTDFAAYAAAASPYVEVVVGFGPPFFFASGGPSASVWVRSLS